jgi:hypothetical protein
MEYSYDQPHVKEIVHAMIAEEMKSFTPATNYLAHLPYPSLRFANSTALREEYLRMKKAHGSNPAATAASSSSSSGMPEAMRMNALDMKRYQLQPPDDALEQDVQGA